MKMNYCLLNIVLNIQNNKFIYNISIIIFNIYINVNILYIYSNYILYIYNI